MPTFKLGSNTLNTPSTAEATITGVCPAMGTPYVTQFNWTGTAWIGSAPVAGGTVGFTIPGMGADCSVSSCAGTVPWVGSWQFDFVNQTFSVCYNITFDGRCCGLPPGVPTGIRLCLGEPTYPQKACACTCECDCPCSVPTPGGARKAGGGGPVEGVPPAGATPEQISLYPIRYATGEAVIEADDLASRGFGTAWGHHRSYSNRLGINQDFGNGYNWQVAHWPSLEPQTGGTMVVVGHNHEMLWFDPVSGGYAARYGVTSTLTKLADDHFLLSDTQGNVTELVLWKRRPCVL